MKIADMRVQTTSPTAPDAGVVGLYANASGVLVKITSAGTTSSVADDFLTTYTNTNVVTGRFSQTGLCFGSAVANNTGLATPTVWLRVNVSGTNYAVPAYATR